VSRYVVLTHAREAVGSGRKSVAQQAEAQGELVGVGVWSSKRRAETTGENATGDPTRQPVHTRHIPIAPLRDLKHIRCERCDIPTIFWARPGHAVVVGLGLDSVGHVGRGTNKWGRLPRCCCTAVEAWVMNRVTKSNRRKAHVCTWNCWRGSEGESSWGVGATKDCSGVGKGALDGAYGARGNVPSGQRPLQLPSDDV
jgi:hypothetical protein